jgi:uncharacterized membrane protein YvbJ
MFCKKCGVQMDADATFCSKCGTSQGATVQPQQPTAPQQPMQYATAPPQKKSLAVPIMGGVIGLLVVVGLVFFLRGNGNWC